MGTSELLDGLGLSWDLIGYVASALVLAAFYMREMVPLRIVALCSNLAFIAYGAALGLTPIWLLHILLLPMNGWRLVQAVRSRSFGRAGRSTRVRRAESPRVG
jgi:hypothetical protein